MNALIGGDNCSMNAQAGGKRRNKNKRNKSMRRRRGGNRSGVLETAAVPFGLFAMSHLFSRKKKSKRRRTNKSYRKKKNKSYKK